MLVSEMPCASAIFLYNLSCENTVISPYLSSQSAAESSALYRISCSFSKGFVVAFSAAVFSSRFFIIPELLSAVLACEGDEISAICIATMLVPPLASAVIRAELFCLFAGKRGYRSSALFADDAGLLYRVSADIGADSVKWQ